jgi:hypothetical protein
MFCVALNLYRLYAVSTGDFPRLSAGFVGIPEHDCEITGMPVANASMYDGATAMAEAAILACHATNRKEILVARSVHPLTAQLCAPMPAILILEIKEIDFTGGGYCS